MKTRPDRVSRDAAPPSHLSAKADEPERTTPAWRDLKTLTGALAVVVCVWYMAWGALGTQYLIGTSSDFLPHVESAVLLHQGQNEHAITHPMYAWFVLLVLAVEPTANYATSGLVAALILYEMAAVLLFARFLNFRGAASWAGAGIAAVAAVSLMLANPITSATVCIRNLYIGYVNANVYHNPTMLALKPFALAAFWCAAHVLSAPSERRHVRALAGLAVFSILASLAKPNFALCFLPALATYCLARWLWRLRRERTWDWTALLCLASAALPTVGTLAWQLVQYTEGQAENRFAFAPFADANGTWFGLLFRFVLSVAFVLAVAACFPRRTGKTPSLVLAWLTFVAGYLIASMFIEEGPRRAHGNFGWTAQIAVYILFVESVAFLLDLGRERETAVVGQERMERRTTFCWMLYACHVSSGFAFYMLYPMGIRAEQYFY